MVANGRKKRIYSSKYPFSGLLFCGNCGDIFHGSYGTSTVESRSSGGVPPACRMEPRPTSAIDEKIKTLQIELIGYRTDSPDAERIGIEILTLRDEKESILFKECSAIPADKRNQRTRFVLRRPVRPADHLRRKLCPEAVHPDHGLRGQGGICLQGREGSHNKGITPQMQKHLRAVMVQRCFFAIVTLPAAYDGSAGAVWHLYKLDSTRIPEQNVILLKTRLGNFAFNSSTTQ